MAGNENNVVATAWVKIIPTFSGAEQEITEGVTEAMAGVKDSVEETEKKTNRSLKNTFTKMGAIGGIMSATVTPAITSVGKSSIESAVEFENTFSYMGSILDNFSGDIDGMKSTAINTAKSTIFGVQEVADAMVILGKAGMSEANIKGKALTSTLNLAAAAGIDLEESSNAIVRAMNAFNLTGNDTERVADALTWSANESTTEVHDLMLGFQQASAEASKAGWSVEQTAGALAMFADSGVTGSDAGTSLKTMLRRLGAPTENAEMLMNQLGFQIYDAAGNMLGFEEIIPQFAEKLGNLSDQERNHALSLIFGSDASRAAYMMTLAADKGLEHYIATEEAQGIAAEQATKRNSEAGFSIERMNNSIEAAQIALGQALLPIVTVVAEAIAQLATWFSNLPEPVRMVIGVVGGVVAAIGPLLAMIGLVGSGIATIVPIIGGLISPIGLVIAAVVAVVGAIVTWLATTEEGHAVIDTIANALGAFGGIVIQVAGWIGENLGNAIHGFAEGLVGVGDTIAGFVSGAISGIQQFASDVRQKVSDAGNAFNEFKNNAGQALANAASAAQQKMGEIGSSIKTKMSEAAKGAKTAWDTMSRLAGEVGGKIKTKAIEAFTGLAKGIHEKMEGAKQLVSSAISAIAGIFSGANFQLPHINLPHFNISGSFSLNPISIPHISVDWYKSGGIATKASIVGVGEAGPEAIMPLQGPRFDQLTDSIAEKIKPSGVIVNVSELVVREEADIDRIASRLAQLTRRRSMTGVYA